jgi:hypothetical protein
MTMTTSEFLEYLHRHPATTDLAEALAEIAVLRGRRDLVPAGLAEPPHRVAS